MIRAGVLTLAILALPGVAAAHCGSTQGSFALTCENGVKVYRHQAPSAIPMGLTPAQTQLKIAKLRQQTAQQRIAAERDAQADKAELRRAEIENERYRNRIYAQDALRRRRGYHNGYGYGFGYRGYYGAYTLARPVRTHKARH